MSAVRPRILGIDPGTRVIGFALIEAVKIRPLGPKDWSIVDIGVMRASTGLDLTNRLGEIHAGLHHLISETSPRLVAIEKAFHGLNAATAIKLGEARGALIAAILRHQLPVHEVTPAEVKRLIAGHGAAEKEQVYRALKSLTGFELGELPLDASDALGIALAASLRVMVPTQVAAVTAGRSPAHSARLQQT